MFSVKKKNCISLRNRKITEKNDNTGNNKKDAKPNNCNFKLSVEIFLLVTMLIFIPAIF